MGVEESIPEVGDDGGEGVGAKEDDAANGNDEDEPDDNTGARKKSFVPSGKRPAKWEESIVRGQGRLQLDNWRTPHWPT